MNSPKPHWLCLIPRITFARGVPVVRVADSEGERIPVIDEDKRQTGVVCTLGRWNDDGVAQEVLVECNGGTLIESKDNFLVNLEDPQGFAYALRYYMTAVYNTDDEGGPVFTETVGGSAATAHEVWSWFGMEGCGAYDHWLPQLAAALATLPDNLAALAERTPLDERECEKCSRIGQEWADHPCGYGGHEVRDILPYLPATSPEA